MSIGAENELEKGVCIRKVKLLVKILYSVNSTWTMVCSVHVKLRNPPNKKQVCLLVSDERPNDNTTAKLGMYFDDSPALLKRSCYSQVTDGRSSSGKLQPHVFWKSVQFLNEHPLYLLRGRCVGKNRARMNPSTPPQIHVCNPEKEKNLASAYMNHPDLLRWLKISS